MKSNKCYLFWTISKNDVVLFSILLYNTYIEVDF